MYSSRYLYYNTYIIKDTLVLTQSISTPMQLSKWQKIVLSNSTKTGKLAASTLGALEIVTGQRAKYVCAKKSIANYKVTQGQVSSSMVTLRRIPMFAYLDMYITLIKPEQLYNYSSEHKQFMLNNKINIHNNTAHKRKIKHTGLNLAMQSYLEYPELKNFFSQFSLLKGKHINMVIKTQKCNFTNTHIWGF